MCGGSGGGETQTTVVNQQQQPTPTPEQTAMNQLQLQQMQQTMPGQTQAQLSGLNLINQLLTGATPLPGFFGTMGAGISPEAIGTQATSMALNALPQFQSMGLTESGVAGQEISKNIANNLLFPAEQFNIGALQNLMNIALTGQAQVQQPILAGNQILSTSLSGLQGMTTSGQSTWTGMNPFVKSFQQSLGTGLGNIFNPQTYMGSGGMWGAKGPFG